MPATITTHQPMAPQRPGTSTGEQSLVPYFEAIHCRGYFTNDDERDWQDTAEKQRVGMCEPDRDGKLKFKDIDTGETYFSLREIHLESLKQPHVRKQHVLHGSSGSVYTQGGAVPDTPGTKTAEIDNTTTYCGFASTATDTRAGVLSNAYSIVRLAHKPLLVTKLRTPTNLTNLRLWIGLFSGDPSGDAGATNHVGFRYSTDAGDTTWMASRKNGTTQATTALGSIAADTIYTLELSYNPATGKASFRINSGAVTLVETFLPAESTNLGYAAVVISDSLLSVRSFKFATLLLAAN